ncbi:stAR-related lipid transfer protein 7, mitochondrial [Cariama cristata]
MLQPRRPLVGLVARCARTARLGPRPPGSTEAPPAPGGQAGGGAGRRGLLGLLARQCSCVTGQRARRARRAWYRGGGSGGDGAAERARRGGGGGGWWWWWWRGLLRGRPAFAATGRLMATLAGVFVWDGQRIEEEELQRSAQEMKHMENMSSLLQGGSPGEYQRPDLKSGREAVAAPGEQPWEMIMDKKHFKLWRRPIEGTHLYQYRVFGSYTDVTPRQFFNVQLDTEYRKKWDSLWGYYKILRLARPRKGAAGLGGTRNPRQLRQKGSEVWPKRRWDRIPPPPPAPGPLVKPTARTAAKMPTLLFPRASVPGDFPGGGLAGFATSETPRPSQ